MVRFNSTFAPPWLAAALLSLGAIWWGGGTNWNAQTAILAMIGSLFIVWPAAQWPPAVLRWIAPAWLALAALAWCPANWFSLPAWRFQMAEAGVDLPGTLSPQPQLTIEALIWLFAGLAWLGWLCAMPIDSAARRMTVRILAAGAILITVVALVAWWVQWPVPGWLSERGFGPFPNRNHTGHVLALGGLLVLACVVSSARRRTLAVFFWSAGALVIVAGLVVNYSRGGLLLFFGAAAFWAAFESYQRRSWPLAALTTSLLLVGAAGVLLGGGPVAGRFAGGGDAEVGFRLRIWKDTLSMISAAPWCGDGLGNFRALFPFYRQASVIQQAVWHPESDWLWLIAENFWFGAIFAAVVLIGLLREVFPFGKESHGRLRAPIFFAVTGAALHSFVDVPMHRPASALLALLLFALARYEAKPPQPSPGARGFWRVVGLLLIGAACWRGMEKDALAEAQTLIRENRMAEARAAASRALVRAPLDWRAYYVRAAASADEGQVLTALNDFRRARLLEPHNAAVALEEGRFWSTRVAPLALPAWKEALQRSGPPADREAFRAMLNAAPADPSFRTALLELATGRPALQIQWFCSASANEAAPHRALLVTLLDQAEPAQAGTLRDRLAEIEAVNPR